MSEASQRQQLASRGGAGLNWQSVLLAAACFLFQESVNYAEATSISLADRWGLKEWPDVDYRCLSPKVEVTQTSKNICLDTFLNNLYDDIHMKFYTMSHRIKWQSDVILYPKGQSSTSLWHHNVTAKIIQRPPDQRHTTRISHIFSQRRQALKFCMIFIFIDLLYSVFGSLFNLKNTHLQALVVLERKTIVFAVLSTVRYLTELVSSFFPQMIRVAWLFYFSKYIELLDTVRTLSSLQTLEFFYFFLWLYKNTF